MDHQKMTDKREYLSALEEERKKIEIFQRELPLSFQIVNESTLNFFLFLPAITRCNHNPGHYT
jgi:hypothetical protein